MPAMSILANRHKMIRQLIVGDIAQLRRLGRDFAAALTIPDDHVLTITLGSRFAHQGKSTFAQGFASLAAPADVYQTETQLLETDGVRTLFWQNHLSSQLAKQVRIYDERALSALSAHVERPLPARLFHRGVDLIENPNPPTRASADFHVAIGAAFPFGKGRERMVQIFAPNEAELSPALI